MKTIGAPFEEILRFPWAVYHLSDAVPVPKTAGFQDRSTQEWLRAIKRDVGVDTDESGRTEHLWSDDFEPNTSVKSNRGSVWIKTHTFVILDSIRNDITNTQTIAIGHKGYNHNSVKLLYLRN